MQYFGIQIDFFSIVAVLGFPPFSICVGIVWQLENYLLNRNFDFETAYKDLVAFLLINRVFIILTIVI